MIPKIPGQGFRPITPLGYLQYYSVAGPSPWLLFFFILSNPLWHPSKQSLPTTSIHLSGHNHSSVKYHVCEYYQSRPRMLRSTWVVLCTPTIIDPSLGSLSDLWYCRKLWTSVGHHHFLPKKAFWLSLHINLLILFLFFFIFYFYFYFVRIVNLNQRSFTWILVLQLNWSIIRYCATVFSCLLVQQFSVRILSLFYESALKSPQLRQCPFYRHHN